MTDDVLLFFDGHRAAPGRWTHHVLVGSPEEIDGELLAWIGEVYRFSEGKR